MTLRELGILLRSIGRVMLDSELTTEIHVAEELTGREAFRRWRDTLFRSQEAHRLLDERPELNSDQVNYGALRALPADTLGGAYVRHLDRFGLTADSQASATRYVDDPEIAYLMRRFRQTHDVWHALTDLGTSGHEEVILHAFSWGQLRLPVSALIVAFGSLKHLVLEARWGALRHALLEAYRHGRDASPLLPVYWEKIWSEPLADVQTQLGVAPCSRAFVDG